MSGQLLGVLEVSHRKSK